MSIQYRYQIPAVAAALMLIATPSGAEIEHRQFSDDNYMYKVANDDWQPEGFDTGRVVPVAYHQSPDITIDGRDGESAELTQEGRAIGVDADVPVVGGGWRVGVEGGRGCTR